MERLQELKAVVRSIVCSCPGGRAKLAELDKQFEKQEGVELLSVVENLGFASIEALLDSWPDMLIVSGGEVRVKQLDHIAQMNKFSKKSGNKKKTQGYQGSCEPSYRRPFSGKCPFEFSTDESLDSIEVYDNEENIQKLVDAYVAPSNKHEDEIKLPKSVVPLKPMIEATKALKCATQTALKPAEPCSALSSKHINHSEGLNIVTTTDKTVPPCRPLDISKPIAIRFLEGVNPHRFWFAELTDYKTLNKLMRNLKEFYSKNELRIDAKLIKQGLLVAAEFAGLWHRSVVVEVFDHTIARVFLIDFGSVEDLDIIEKIRYLAEDFISTPRIARRGTLSHVTPKDGIWNVDCIKLFNERLAGEEIDAKVFKHLKHDWSYQMALRCKFDSDVKVLVTEAFIKRGWCTYDPDFCENNPGFASDIATFQDYEMGKHKEKPALVTDDNWLPEFEDSWLPQVKSKHIETEEAWLPLGSNYAPKKIEKVEKPKKVERVETAKKIETVQATRIERISTKVSACNVDPIQEKNVAKPTSSSCSSRLIKQKLPQSDVPSLMTPVPSQQNIVEQSLRRFPIGSIKKINVHLVHEELTAGDFSFYLKEEFDEIKIYLENFNYAYNNFSELPSCDNLSVGTDVAVFVDENFCRARIIEGSDDDTSFQLLLVDFGFTVERTKNKIFKLTNEWKTRQAAAYKGKLSNIPEHYLLKTRDQLVQKVLHKCVEVKVHRIDKGQIYLILINP